MNTITLFLASSNELLDDRERFEIEINRKNKLWQAQGLFLHLDIWEDLTARMSATRSQDDYNRHIQQADIFILLAHSKVGMYTAEEFETAFGAFKSSNKPIIFTYFKHPSGQTDPSLQQFKDKLDDLGHFYASYSDSNDLWSQFNKELERLNQQGLGGNNPNEAKREGVTVDNRGANIKNQFNDGTFSNITFE